MGTETVRSFLIESQIVGRRQWLHANESDPKLLDLQSAYHQQVYRCELVNFTSPEKRSRQCEVLLHICGVLLYFYDFATSQELTQPKGPKFLAGQSHGALSVVMGVVLPSEGDVGIVNRENAVIGNSHAMRVASQIVQHMLWTVKGWLGVNDPVFSKQGAQECCEGFFIGQREAFSVERQLVSSKSASQSGHELSTKNTTENSHR
jgi:hypothetical protein